MKITFIARILLLLLAIGLSVLLAKAQPIPVPTCCTQAINLQKQVISLTTALSDSTAKLDRAWSIIAAYRAETSRLRDEYSKSLLSAQAMPLHALMLVESYQNRGCFLGLCYRKRMQKIKDILIKVRQQ